MLQLLNVPLLLNVSATSKDFISNYVAPYGTIAKCPVISLFRFGPYVTVAKSFVTSY